MRKDYYLNIAKQNKRMVFGVDLILGEKDNRDEILLNGEMLGKVILETAQRFNMPMALPFMDLDVEKQELLEILNIDLTQFDHFHFGECNLSQETISLVKNVGFLKPTLRLAANCEAISFCCG